MSLPYQNVLLTPRPAQSSSTLGLPYGLDATDVILTVLTLLTIYTQFMADNQQYHFQTYKQHVKKSQSQDDINVNIPRNVTTYKQGPFDITWTPKDAQRGFITKGLWAWSRHPNFACEMTFWALQGLFPLLSASSASGGAGLTVGDKRGMVLPSPIKPAIAVSRSRDFEFRAQEVRQLNLHGLVWTVVFLPVHRFDMVYREYYWTEGKSPPFPIRALSALQVKEPSLTDDG
jgi:hypothetical protein